jgi:uncharacterized protein (DUF433 family)
MVQPSGRLQQSNAGGPARPEEGMTVPTTLREALATQNPVDVPLYTPWDVARYLRVPLWTALALVGRGRPDPDWFFHHFWRRFPPFVVADDLPDSAELTERVSFRQLADLYVRAFAVQSLAEWWRAEPRERNRWEVFHETAWRVLEGRWHEPVFFRPVVKEGVTRVLESFSRALPETDRAWLEKQLTLCLDRVEQKEEEPSRLYPFSRIPAEGCPRLIVMDPRIRFGRPTITGRGVPTDAFFERHQAGDSITELADDYNIPTVEVEEAIRYEARPTILLFPFPGW